MTQTTPVEPTFAIRVIRTAPDGRRQTVEFEGYAILRELMDDIESYPVVREWIAESGE